MTLSSTAPSAIPVGYKAPPGVLLGMCIGVSIYWLFALSMGPLLPPIAKDFGVSAPDLALPMSLAGLVSGIFIMPAGGLADRLGRLRMTRIGLALGLAGMLAAGLAPDMTTLTIGRFLQGLAAAAIMPATLALVKVYYDDEARPQAISYWSMSTFGCASVASVFGGLVASSLGWRWAFLLAIPFILAAFWMLRAAPESKVESAARRPFDTLGFGVLIVGLLALNLFVSKGNAWGWTSPWALGALAVAVVALAIFIPTELRCSAPIADLTLFNRRAFTGATLANFFLNTLLGLLVVLLTYLQRGRGLDALTAALLTLSYTVTVLVMIRVGEKVGKRVGPRLPMTIGGLCFIVTSAMLAMTSIADNTLYFILVFIGMGFMGTGLGLFATPATNAAVGEAPADKAGAAGGVFKMASSLGGAFGIALHLAAFGGVMAAGGDIHKAAAVALGMGVVAAALSALISFLYAPGRKTA